MAFLAVRGRGGVHVRAPDDERAPETPAFDRFYTALPAAVRRCLVEGGAERADPEELLSAIPDASGFPVEETLLDVLRLRGALDAAGCAALRRAVDARRSCYPDSVDRMPEHQLDLSCAELERLIGAPAVGKL